MMNNAVEVKDVKLMTNFFVMLFQKEHKFILWADIAAGAPSFVTNN